MAWQGHVLIPPEPDAGLELPRWGVAWWGGGGEHSGALTHSMLWRAQGRLGLARTGAPIGVEPAARES